jgi:two-component system, cell cycle response regulator
VARARQAALEIIGHEQLRVQALTDPLTRLGNRRKLTADVERRLAGGEGGSPLSLVLLDLDRFKQYNDAFGHGAGDDLLVDLAAQLTAALADAGAAYRLGGDEFCVTSSSGPQALESTLEEALLALRSASAGEAVGASYGTVLIPDEARELGEALHIADQRMYAHKRGREESRNARTPRA